MFDVHDILEANRPSIEEAPPPPIAKRGPKPKGPKPPPIMRRKPEGMHRELFALLNTSDSDTPLLPSDYAPISQNSYKQVRANLSIKRPRKWDLVEFTNSARKDDLILKHWQRADSSQQDYAFAKYNKNLSDHIPKYKDAEYHQYLHCDQWTKEETDYLMQMCLRFDLRFIVIHDKWDRNRFKTERSVEDLKERYYFVHNQLEKYRVSTTSPPKLKEYDSMHEKKRKEQLLKLYNRTKEQIEEEQNLLNELKKIDQKKRERERKMQDLQKIMDAGRSAPDHHKRHDSTPASVGRPPGSGTRGMPGRRPGRGAGRPSRESLASMGGSTSQVLGTAASLLEMTTMPIKFPDFKTTGASLRSQRLKLPTSLGGKKAKGLEGMLNELKLDLYPMPTETICQSFNELRSDLLLLYELKMSLESTKFENNSIRDQIKTLKPDLVPVDSQTEQSSQPNSQDSSMRDISDVIDINAANTPGRKRKAALEQSNVLRKLKKTL